MVFRLREYPCFLQIHGKMRKQLVETMIMNCGRKHLSGLVTVNKKHGYLREKFNELVNWYDEFTGMDEVRQAQRRVLEDEKNFRRTQEERRTVLSQLNDIQGKLKDLYAEIDTTNRGDERYVHLVTHEHKLLKEEKVILEKFSVAEKNERDSFAALSTSVKLSHEKERAQSERTKYWSIIGSIMGTVIGILGTSINNHFKMNELKELIKNSSDKQLIEGLNNYLESNEKLLAKLKENYKVMLSSNSDVFENLFNKLNSRLDTVEHSLKKIEKNSGNSQYTIVENDEGYKVVTSVESLAETMKKDYTQAKMFLFTMAVLSIVIPLVIRYQ